MEQHTIETLHAEFCKSILRVQRKTPNKARREELGQFPLLINIQKRATKLYNHLKTSDPHSCQLYFYLYLLPRQKLLFLGFIMDPH